MTPPTWPARIRASRLESGAVPVMLTISCWPSIRAVDAFWAGTAACDGAVMIVAGGIGWWCRGRERAWGRCRRLALAVGGFGWETGEIEESLVGRARLAVVWVREMTASVSTRTLTAVNPARSLIRRAVGRWGPIP